MLTLRFVSASLLAIGLMSANAPALTPPPTPAPAPAPPRFLPPGMPQSMPGVSVAKQQNLLFKEGADARAQIDAATRIAAGGEKHVLVFWGYNGSSGQESLREMIDMPEAKRTMKLEYEVVYANVGDDPFGRSNFALAQVFGGMLSQGEPHALMMILDERGVPVAQQGMAGFTQPGRSSHYHPTRFLQYLEANKRPRPSADDLLNAALARAKNESRAVFLHFYEPGDLWSERFERWLAQPEVAAITDQRVVPLRINLQRDPGGAGIFARYAVRAESHPWYAILDDNGGLLVMSQPPGKRNIGFPTEDAEIDAFLTLLRVAAPGLTEEEAGILKGSLVADRVARTTPPAPTPQSPAAAPEKPAKP